jgi:hypothetical protein
LVVLVRHGVGLGQNDAASRFDTSNPEVERAISSLENRVERIDPRELPAASAQLRALAAYWEKLAAEAAAEGRKLFYQASKPHAALLQNFGEARPGWDTLHSMRNVDRTCAVGVIGEDR